MKDCSILLDRERTVVVSELSCSLSVHRIVVSVPWAYTELSWVPWVLGAVVSIPWYECTLSLLLTYREGTRNGNQTFSSRHSSLSNHVLSYLARFLRLGLLTGSTVSNTSAVYLHCSPCGVLLLWMTLNILSWFMDIIFLWNSNFFLW
jgi:hypothetical protein